MELNYLFEQAIINSKTLPQKPGNDILLKLYAFCKQSSEGDVNAVAPSNPFDFVGQSKIQCLGRIERQVKRDCHAGVYRPGN